MLRLSKKTPLYITRLVMFIILEGLMLHVVCYPVLRCSKQRVKSFIILFLYMDRIIAYFNR